MIKHLSLVHLSALVAGLAALCAFGPPTTVSADDVQTSTASVTFTMPKDSAVAASDMPTIDFSSAKVSSSAQDVTADSVDAPVAVTNPGFANAWSVSVAASDFTNTDNTQQIHSALLTFDATAAQSGNADSVATAPTVTDTTITTGGDQAALVKADRNGSAGTFKTEFASSAVHLHIPAGNTAGDYSAKLKWTLTDAIE